MPDTTETILDPGPSRPRSIRFALNHEKAIDEKAKSLGLDFSTFVRLCALKGAGIADQEVARVKQLADTLEKVGIEPEAKRDKKRAARK